jgi:hypothetical protein
MAIPIVLVIVRRELIRERKSNDSGLISRVVRRQRRNNDNGINTYGG